jgi:glycosyltransferase involved in cell wall biosynthesis
LRVLRVYHAGRDPAHRARERALASLGVDITLVVPSAWPENGAERRLSAEPFDIVEMDLRRAGDVNRHVYSDPAALSRLIADRRPDVVDLHEEPFSLAARQWLRAARDLPVTMYTAQNVDKRFPPPYARYETRAYGRAAAIYPCTRQAAAVARGKGFTGLIRVLPLGVDPVYSPGSQSLAAPEVRLGIIGRLVPEKGVQDAVRVLAALRVDRPARLVVVGQGPEEGPALALAKELGVAAAVEFLPWQSEPELARLYRDLHGVLVPSRATETWVEQFGRIIVEGQASGAVIFGYASGAISEVGGDAAVLTAEGDAGALADAVRSVVNDENRYATLRRKGMERAAHAVWPSVAHQQAELYDVVASGRVVRTALPRSSDLRRRVAEQEFGPSATLVGGAQRPFALPLLRRDRRCTRLLGSAVDMSGRLIGR